MLPVLKMKQLTKNKYRRTGTIKPTHKMKTDDLRTPL